MNAVYVVSPFEGGWCVKISQTGEVLFFKTAGEAERRARALASADPQGEVWIHGRDGRLVGRWLDGASRPSASHLLDDDPARQKDMAA
ncbi:DUF2188 domain-containing protein [Caulobacter hibisci]|uniref:DUF2188 domain-containing protein n=1 Tax=Caulobacter hibisci TaxID=2035993 RepID=A0ABS0SXN8_9CAUL|nr:DUF2188 domain-containing protein [Caulobacter hibisci]MBI1684186.1 DUF2188 domain-containing protein [Caulobacter hibisci]